MSNGTRYGAGANSRNSPEAVLAAIQTEIKNQSNQINVISKKLDNVSTTVTSMNTQMGHLVTKESCSEGRKVLSEDLKKRMDGDRDITGTDIKVPILWQEAVAAKMKSESTSPESTQSVTVEVERKPKGFVFWLSIAAAVVTISAGVIGVTFTAYKVISVVDSTNTMMQQIQSQQQSSH